MNIDLLKLLRLWPPFDTSTPSSAANVDCILGDMGTSSFPAIAAGDPIATSAGDDDRRHRGRKARGGDKLTEEEYARYLYQKRLLAQQQATAQESRAKQLKKHKRDIEAAVMMLMRS